MKPLCQRGLRSADLLAGTPETDAGGEMLRFWADLFDPSGEADRFLAGIGGTYI